MRNRILLPVLLLSISAAGALNCVGRQTPLARSTAPHAQAPPHGFFYVMQPGDTLYRLALRYDLPVEALLRSNHIENIHRIPIGSKIFIPLKNTDASHAEKQPLIAFLWPVQGTLHSHFGVRKGRSHHGIDIAASRGTAIRAAAFGKVIFSGTSRNAYGKYIKIQHASSLISLYAHNSMNVARRGDHVQQGQVIARVGKTGNATGPHCHFEIRRNGRPIDPLPLLTQHSTIGSKRN